MPPGIKLGNEGHLGDFIDGLGPAQIVGRQVLASPSMGDIQLALHNRKGMLEVEVIRAKGLLPKPGSKILPGKLSIVNCFILSNIKSKIMSACKSRVTLPRVIKRAPVFERAVYVSSPRTKGPFLESPGNFSGPQSYSKISNRTITELSNSHILRMSRVSHHTRSSRHILLL